MMRRGTIGGVGLFGVALVVLACSSGADNDDGTGPVQAACVPGSGGAAVTVGDNFFNPMSVTVPVNGRVTWTWSGVLPHNVTFVTGPAPLPGASCTQSAGTHNVTFATAGTYGYTCTVHAGMDGSVTVTP
jgi:plastocyanin